MPTLQHCNPLGNKSAACRTFWHPQQGRHVELDKEERVQVLKVRVLPCWGTSVTAGCCICLGRLACARHILSCMHQGCAMRPAA